MKEHILSTFQNSSNYTMAVAEAMPDNSFNFKPLGGGWNFMELLHHIGYGIEWWTENYIKGKKLAWDQPPATANKEETVRYLKSSFAKLEETINKATLTDKAVQGFYATIDHITHHRGQCVVYLRCNAINPPEYTY